jgi:hypothetical protein
MIKETEDQKTRNYILMRRIMDFGMGFLIMGFGIFFIFAEKLGVAFNVEPFFRYFFAGLCIVYGAWRVYRGYQRNYFKE